MKLYTFLLDGQLCLGAEKAGKLVNLTAIFGINDMVKLIEAYDQLGLKEAVEASETLIDFSSVNIQAPVRPNQVLCSGLNYKSHIQENPNAKFLSEPRFFAKLPHSIIGPNAPILHPGEQFWVDYEVEFAVVFKKAAYRLREDQAMDHVFGYTILHDVSSRFIQFKDANEMMGKNFASFSPIGPCIVTADEIPHPEQCRIIMRVNGEVLQDGTNADWCFTLPHLLAWVTMAIPFTAGDIVTTGTCAGIGYFRNPQRFLSPGDVCELEIPEIGKLINPVVADPYPI